MTYRYLGKSPGKRYIPKLTMNRSILYCLNMLLSSSEFIESASRVIFLPEYTEDIDHSFELLFFEKHYYRTKDVLVMHHRFKKGWIIDDIEIYPENGKLDFVYSGYEWGEKKRPWTLKSRKMNWKWIEAQLKLICVSLI